MEKVRADKLKAKLAEDEINVTDSVADVIRYHHILVTITYKY